MNAPASNGVVIGIVSNLEDPEQLGRIRVTYPHINDQSSDWARLATLMAGPQRGAFFRPEVGDEVLVAFEHADPRRPYVLGALWSMEDKPPDDDGDARQNNWRFFVSRSGHLFKFDDTAGAELIEIAGKSGVCRIVIDDANNKTAVTCDSGDIDVLAPSGTVYAEGSTVHVKAQDVKVEAQTIQITGDAKVSIEAPAIDVKAEGTMNLESGGVMTIKGSIVNIN